MADTLPISPRAYGYDPSWFTGDRIPTQMERVQQARDAWRAANPGAPYMPSDAELGYQNASTREELFPGQLMTQQGDQAYKDLVTKLNRKDDLSNVLTTAALAAAAFGGASLMNPASTGTLGTGATGVESLAGVSPELTAPLSTAGSQAAASQLALGGIPGLEAAGGTGVLGGLGAAGEGIGTLGGLGYEAPALMGGVSPGLTAPLSTVGGDAAFAQLMADPILSASVGIPELGSYALKPVADVGSMATGGLLSSIGGGIKDFLAPAASLVGGGGNLAALVGAGLGAASSGGNTVSEQQKKTDPRIDPYIYGTGTGDPNSILGAAQKLYQSNPSGINQTMQQGLDMQRSALTDPQYAQSLQQMRTMGMGLLGNGVAGNPTQMGQSPTMQAGGGLIGNQDRAKALIARGRGLIGG